MRQPVPAETTYLFLVRHGATTANERKPYILQGSGIDLPLSEAGEQQALAVGRFLSTFAIDAVYSSTMLRARQTAQEIATAHGLVPEPLDGLTECHVGQWEGMDWESIEREFPEPFKAFRNDPGNTPYFGGESYADVLRRARPVLDRVLERHAGGRVVVVAHNVVNRVYLANLLGLELRFARELHQQNACVNVIRRDALGTSVLTMNSAFHVP